jgi:hypothetical protein
MLCTPPLVAGRFYCKCAGDFTERGSNPQDRKESTGEIQKSEVDEIRSSRALQIIVSSPSRHAFDSGNGRCYHRMVRKNPANIAVPVV